jgi:ribose 5-phosphate isomerase B
MKNSRKLITEKDIQDLILKGKRKLEVAGNEIITPAARDKINENLIKIVKVNFNSTANFSNNLTGIFSTYKKVAIGSDHTGFAIKKLVKKYLEDKGYEITDVGTFDENSCDYPDFAIKVAEHIQQKQSDFGILLDATGIPSAITANKISGIRAATCYNEFSAKSAREHNNANIIVMGAKTLGEETIKSILETFLNSNFLGERHQRRLDKITQLEKNK